jgi:type II secretory pathway component PulL
MTHPHSIFRISGRKIGLAFLREQGLDLEVWDGGPRPCWSMGVVRAENGSAQPEGTIRIPAVSQWLLVLPSYLCTTRCIQLPSSRPEEIAAMLEFEIPQLVPYHTQPWTWDFCVADPGQDGASQVLVVLSPLSVVESALEQTHALGIEPFLVTVAAALGVMRPTHNNAGQERKLRGQVWWDHGSLDFSGVQGSRLMFLRGVRIRGQNSHALECAEVELDRSLSLFRAQGLGNRELSIRVGGTNPDVPSLIERLNQSASGRADQACTWEPCDGAMTGPTAPGSWRPRRARIACINLLPRHRKERDRRIRRRRELLGIGLRVCVIALLMLLCLRMSVWRQTRMLEQYQQRIAQIAPLAQRLQFLESQLSMIRNQVQGSVSMLDILSQMYEILPQDVTIHYLSIDQNRQVVVRAQAKWLSQAFDCIDPLEQSAYLSNVRQSYAHLRELEGQVLIDFELRADLERRPAQEAGL